MSAPFKVRDLPRLHNGQHWEWSLREMHPLEREVFRIAIIEQFLNPLLTKLKDAGYKKVWIGTPNPHWKTDMWSNMIVTEPRIKEDKPGGDLLLWKVYKSLTNDYSCGNGLRKADQIQGAGWLCVVNGEYDLTQLG